VKLPKWVIVFAHREKNSRVLEANEWVSENIIFHFGCQINMREFLRIYYRFYLEKLFRVLDNNLRDCLLMGSNEFFLLIIRTFGISGANKRIVGVVLDNHFFFTLCWWHLIEVCLTKTSRFIKLIKNERYPEKLLHYYQLF
jgi:hypothetical protein